MNNLENTLIFKDGRFSNDIFVILKELDNHYIVRREDTRTGKTDIIALKKDYVSIYMYTAKEFIESSRYVGHSVYSPNMPEILIYMFQSLILVYKNDRNELYYDTLTNSFFISEAILKDEEIIISPVQYDINFKNWLGKK